MLRYINSLETVVFHSGCDLIAACTTSHFVWEKEETVKTVPQILFPFITGLKPGVNERGNLRTFEARPCFESTPRGAKAAPRGVSYFASWRSINMPRLAALKTP